MIRKSPKKIKNTKKLRDYRRKLTIRKKISGTAEIPRICTVKTNMHLQVQVIDDKAGKTLFSVQTFGKNKVADKGNVETAAVVGKAVSEKLAALNVKKAVFDRNGKKYCGVVSAVASNIRENGIQI